MVRSHKIEPKNIKKPLYWILEVRPQMKIERQFYFMNFLEKDLETIIYESDYQSLKDRGYEIDGKKFRQVKLGNYGIADLIYYIKPKYIALENPDASYFIQGVITIVELKKDIVDINSLTQSLRYAKAIRRLLEKKGIQNEYKIRISLVGKSIDTSSSFVYLTDLMLDFDSIYRTFDFYKPPISLCIHTYSYKLDGLTFERHSDWFLKNEGF